MDDSKTQRIAKGMNNTDLNPLRQIDAKHASPDLKL